MVRVPPVWMQSSLTPIWLSEFQFQKNLLSSYLCVGAPRCCVCSKKQTVKQIKQLFWMLCSQARKWEVYFGKIYRVRVSPSSYPQILWRRREEEGARHLALHACTAGSGVALLGRDMRERGESVFVCEMCER